MSPDDSHLHLHTNPHSASHQDSTPRKSKGGRKPLPPDVATARRKERSRLSALDNRKKKKEELVNFQETLRQAQVEQAVLQERFKTLERE